MVGSYLPAGQVPARVRAEGGEEGEEEEEEERIARTHASTGCAPVAG